MPYREYPSAWVIDQLRASNFEVTDFKPFKIAYRDTFVEAQINIALSGIEKSCDQSLAKELIQKGIQLKETAHSYIEVNGALRGCRNYVIQAKPIAR